MAENQSALTRIFLRAYGLLLWLNCANSAIIALTASNMGFTSAEVALLTTGGIGVSVITDIAASVIADKRGRKGVLVAAPLLQACGVAIVLGIHSPVGFAIGAIVMVGSTTIANGVPEAAIKAAAGTSHTGHDMATHIYGVFRKIGPILGPAVGGWLFATYGPRVPFLGELLPLGLALSAALLLKKDRSPGQLQAKFGKAFPRVVKQIWDDQILRAYFNFNLGLQLYWSVLDYLTGLFCLSRSGVAHPVGLFAAAVSTGWWLAQVLVAVIVRRKKKRGQILKTPLKLIPIVVGLLALALWLPGWWALVLYVAEVFALGVVISIFNCELQWQTDTKHCSTQLSVFGSAVKLLMIPVTLAFSWLTAMLGANLAYAATCGAGLIIMGLARREYVATR